MKKFIFIISVLLLASCSQKTIEPVTKTEHKTTNSEDIARGKSLYAEHCVKCHQSFNPSDFTEKQWRHEVPPMARKAKIDSEKENLILAYVLAGAKK
jgi:cytochrome c